MQIKEFEKKSFNEELNIFIIMKPFIVNESFIPTFKDVTSYLNKKYSESKQTCNIILQNLILDIKVMKEFIDLKSDQENLLFHSLESKTIIIRLEK